MKTKSQTFKDITVDLDGIEYEDCTFVHCRMILTGTKPLSLKACNLIDCQFTFDGPAGAALELLGALYADGAHEFVEQAFEAIRNSGPRRAHVTN